ncbi:hypothetical protein LCX93_00415 [Sulfurimonas sp. SWIR-19]|uniref:hypothetical protein n=1 Tax=Sulfurimonas sp. SWIR-19 TaxID=2878390 RepID=UPI001CF3737B|nr:hypothetical protein [Sulfurimonas sp. SWIR-19]UCN00410.1 hypothetical protein LCX93_00415 [Sulfurimonas sp. SWIR-19]
MKYWIMAVIIPVTLFLNGCGEDDGGEENTTTASGWHFQGRDCLACHNVDLGIDKHLVFGGTLFKSYNTTDIDDLNQVCDADLAVEFLDNNFNTVYSTASYYDENSKGNKGRGNIFLLDRLFNATLNGSYTVRIIERVSGRTMAQSRQASHNFSGGEYSIDNPQNFSNRLSCNACHNGKTTDFLNASINADLCK